MYTCTCLHAHTHTHTHTHRHMHTYTHRHTDTHTDRQTDRHTHTHINRQTDTHTHSVTLSFSFLRQKITEKSITWHAFISSFLDKVETKVVHQVIRNFNLGCNCLQHHHKLITCLKLPSRSIEMNTESMIEAQTSDVMMCQSLGGMQHSVWQLATLA